MGKLGKRDGRETYGRAGSTGRWPYRQGLDLEGFTTAGQ